MNYDAIATLRTVYKQLIELQEEAVLAENQQEVDAIDAALSGCEEAFAMLGGESEEEGRGGFNSDAEADADVLANAGMGTDEDYGYFGGDDY